VPTLFALLAPNQPPMAQTLVSPCYFDIPPKKKKIFAQTAVLCDEAYPVCCTSSMRGLLNPIKPAYD